MNSLLIFSHEITDTHQVELSGERAASVIKRFSLKGATSLKAGVAGGKRGVLNIEKVSKECIQGNIELTQEAFPRSSCLWIIAIPRPQMVKRILFLGASLGINEIHFIRTENTQKSYFQSKVLESEAIREQLVKGVEQTGDTILPEVRIHEYFKPFMEETIPDIKQRYPVCFPVFGDTIEAKPIAHCSPSADATLISTVGPERGFNAFERSTLLDCGFQAVSLGSRIFQVDHALSMLQLSLQTLRENIRPLSRKTPGSS